MRTSLRICPIFLVVGCATAPITAAPKLDGAEAFTHQDTPPPPEKLPPPEAFARSFRRLIECEEQARTFQDRAPEAAWSYLKACAARGRFTLLPQLLEYWAAYLHRPDAASVLAQVVAARGLLKTDLVTMQQRGLAFFDLASAIDRPLTFRGKTVLFYGQIRGSYEEANTTTVEIDEVELASAAAEAIEGPRVAAERTSRSLVNGQLQSPAMSGDGAASLQHDEVSQRGLTSRRFDTVTEKTGHDVIGRLSRNDPFLSSHHALLFVAKFDDVWRPDRDDAERRVPVVSIVSWHEMTPEAWQASVQAGF